MILQYMLGFMKIRLLMILMTPEIAILIATISLL